jgi:hypothetical protein
LETRSRYRMSSSSVFIERWRNCNALEGRLFSTLPADCRKSEVERSLIHQLGHDGPHSTVTWSSSSIALALRLGVVAGDSKTRFRPMW